MQEYFMTPLIAVISVYMVIVFGMCFRKFGAVSKETSDSVLKLVVNILFPCLIVSKILSNTAFDDVRNIIFPPFTGMCIVLIGIGIAWLYGRYLPRKWTGLKNSQQVGTFAVCVGMLNYGYVPIPLVADLFPNDERMTAILFIENLGIEFLLWTVCIFVLARSIDKTTIKKMFNPPMITIVGTMLLNITGLDYWVPTLIRKPIELVGTSAIPISLLFVGATIVDYLDRTQMKMDLRQMLAVSVGSSILRLLVLPIIIILFARWMPVSHELKVVIVIHGAMASAVFPIVMARFYHGCVKTAIVTVFSNSFLALLTTPFWIAVGIKYIQ